MQYRGAKVNVTGVVSKAEMHSAWAQLQQLKMRGQTYFNGNGFDVISDSYGDIINITGEAKITKEESIPSEDRLDVVTTEYDMLFHAIYIDGGYKHGMFKLNSTTGEAVLYQTLLIPLPDSPISSTQINQFSTFLTPMDSLERIYFQVMQKVGGVFTAYTFRSDVGGSSIFYSNSSIFPGDSEFIFNGTVAILPVGYYTYRFNTITEVFTLADSSGWAYQEGAESYDVPCDEAPEEWQTIIFGGLNTAVDLQNNKLYGWVSPWRYDISGNMYKALHDFYNSNSVCSDQYPDDQIKIECLKASVSSLGVIGSKTKFGDTEINGTYQGDIYSYIGNSGPYPKTYNGFVYANYLYYTRYFEDSDGSNGGYGLFKYDISSYVETLVIVIEYFSTGYVSEALESFSYMTAYNRSVFHSTNLKFYIVDSTNTRITCFDPVTESVGRLNLNSNYVLELITCLCYTNQFGIDSNIS